MDLMADPAAPDAPAELDALAAEYWETYLEAHPLFATGHRRPAVRRPPARPHARRARREVRAAFAALLDRVNEAGSRALHGEDQTSLLMLRETIAVRHRRAATPGCSTGTSIPLEGVPADFLTVPAYQRLETPDDGERMLARWRAMAVYTDRHLDSLRRSLARRAGRLRRARRADRRDPRGPARRAETSDWPLLEPLATLDGRRGLVGRRAGAVHDRPRGGRRRRDPAGVHPAARRAGDRDPARRAARRIEPGMCHVPEGRRRLPAPRSACIPRSTSTPPRSTRSGSTRSSGSTASWPSSPAARSARRSLEDALAHLRGDPALYFASREEVFDKAAACLARAEAAVPDWFGRLPQASCEVIRMGPHEEEHSTVAYYRQPADRRLAARPVLRQHGRARDAAPLRGRRRSPTTSRSPATTSRSRSARSSPACRSSGATSGPTAFFEGWGLYTERLADEMGLYTGDLDRIGVLSFDAWRAARLVVDTGIHAMGWSRDRAIAFMLEHTALAPNNIANEVDRYIVLPGQALAYKLGQLEILRLRDEARRRSATAFDIRGFHDAVLGSGALPLPTLRSVVEAWATGRLAEG